jgi:DNA-binding transcriptional LysR family regulator
MSTFHPSLGNLSLKQLRAFTCVADVCSFTEAAAILNLSQSAVSLLVRELESELGLKLFDRTTRSVHLTEAGAELHPVATRVLQDLGAAVTGSRELAARRRGLVRFACSPVLSSLLLPRVIGAFAQEHPDVTVVLRDVAGGDIVELVASGEVDLAFSVPPSESPYVVEEPVFTDFLAFVYPRSYGWAARRKLSWGEVTANPFIALMKRNPTRHFVDHHASLAGVALKPAYEVSQVWTAIGLVDAGLGVSLIPGHARPIVEKYDNVELRPFEPRAIRRPISLLRRRQRSLTPAAQAFADFIKAYVAAQT